MHYVGLPSNLAPSITNGWNWIGFNGIRSTHISNIYHAWQKGDVVKSRNEFSIWNGSAMVGELQVAGMHEAFKLFRQTKK